MRTRVARTWWGLRDAVRSSLWPIPVMAVLVAVVAGIVLPELERHGLGLPRMPDTGVLNHDPDAARDILKTVASSLVTVTSLTFSLTVVTLQLASSQFSPRLLRTFAQDLFVQLTLGLFLATFVFSLTVLRSVQSEAEGRDEFVPGLSVTVDFVLAVSSVVLLVGFLAHLTRQIRPETMVRTVREDALDTVHVVLDDLPEHEVPEPLPEPGPGAVVSLLVAGSSGFVTALDTADLMRTACGCGATVAVDVPPGEFVVEGLPIARAWRADGVPLPAEDLDRLSRCLSKALVLGPERTAAQDVGFGLRQLADVADKALSPGINDPTTAVHALGQTSVVLCALAGRRLGPVSFGDDDGNLWVGVARPDLADLLDLALSQPRHYGAADVKVAARLITVLRDVAWRVAPVDRDAVRRELDLLRTAVDEAGHLAPERERLVALADEVDQRLVGP